MNLIEKNNILNVIISFKIYYFFFFRDCILNFKKCKNYDFFLKKKY